MSLITNFLYNVHHIFTMKKHSCTTNFVLLQVVSQHIFYRSISQLIIPYAMYLHKGETITGYVYFIQTFTQDFCNARLQVNRL